MCPLTLGLTIMTTATYSPFLDGLDWSKERIALESADAALDSLDSIRENIQNNGNTVSEDDLREIQALCPKDVEIDLPTDGLHDLPSDVVYEKTVVAMEAIGTAIALAFVVALALLLDKVRELFGRLFVKIKTVLTGKKSPGEQIKEMSERWQLLSEIIQELNNLTAGDDEAVTRLKGEIQRLLVTSHNDINNIKTTNFAALTDMIFFSITRGKVPRLFAARAVHVSMYDAFLQHLPTAFIQEVQTFEVTARKLSQKMAIPREFDPDEFKPDQGVYRSLCHDAVAGKPTDETLTAVVHSLKTRVSELLQPPTDAVAGMSIDQLVQSSYWKTWPKAVEEALNANTKFAQLSSEFEAMSGKQFEFVNCRREAVRLVTEHLNAITTLGHILSMTQTRYMEMLETYSRGVNHILAAFVRISDVVQSMKKLSDADKKRLNELLKEAESQFSFRTGTRSQQ